jgi:hypothetical protein
VGGFTLLCVAGLISGLGYTLVMPRPVIVVGLICLLLGVAAALCASFAEARAKSEPWTRSLGRAIKDTARLVLDLVP